MDDYDAPMWTDFTAPSPQVELESYFKRKQCNNESKPIVPKKLDMMDVENEELHSNNQMAKKMPVKVMTPKKGSARKSTRPTTYEDVLNEAMQNLQFSVSKAANNSLHANSSCLLDSPVFKTPKRVTRSMCAQIAGTPKSCTTLKDTLRKEDVIQDEHHCEEESHHEKETEISDEKDDQLNIPTTELVHEVVNETTQINTEIDGMSVEMKLDVNAEMVINVAEGISNDTNSAEKECNLDIIENKTNEVITTETSEISTEEQIEATQQSTVEKEISSKETNQQIQRSRVITSFSDRKPASAPNSKKKKQVSTLTGNAWHRQVLRRKSILTTRNRLSSSNVQQKPESSSKYVSMAEAITKFERSTPIRFRSTSAKSKGVTRVEQMRRVSLKLTRAVSPALMCKNRSRPVTILSTKERELLEFEEAQQNQVKANPVPVNTLKRADSLKKVEKKPITVPEPFDLTESKKSCPSQNSADSKRKAYHKKTVPMIVSTDDRGFIVQDEEILHFGIPLEPGAAKKKNTKIVPFSFEARNRQMQARKDEKKKLLQSEANKPKSGFHARPVPASVTRTTPVPLPGSRITPASRSTPGVSKITPNVNKSKPLLTLGPRQLSFEERNKQLLMKKEEKIKQVLEEDNKTRVFRAQRVPDFKPVMVRGRSRDNLRGKSEENLAIKSTAAPASKKLILSSTTTTKRIPTIRKNSENQENRIGAIPKILNPKKKLTKNAVLSELNTDKRAKQRQDFDVKLKELEQQNDQHRLKEEELRIASEKAQIAELRKMTETKARPMPVYKPLTIMKSTKPLTEAQSPAWSKKKG